MSAKPYIPTYVPKVRGAVKYYVTAGRFPKSISIYLYVISTYICKFSHARTRRISLEIPHWTGLYSRAYIPTYILFTRCSSAPVACHTYISLAVQVVVITPIQWRPSPGPTNERSSDYDYIPSVRLCVFVLDQIWVINNFWKLKYFFVPVVTYWFKLK